MTHTSGSTSSAARPSSTDTGLNLAVLYGVVAGEPTERALSGGSRVVSFDITARQQARRATVPVVWVDPPAPAVVAIHGGLEVVVVGRVERRFFRSGGATQSRTEVVAGDVVPARQTRAVRRLLQASAATIDKGGVSRGSGARTPSAAWV